MAARDPFDPSMATLLGGDADGPALPFDPHAPAAPFDPRVTVARHLTAEEAMSAGTMAFTSSAVSASLPFRTVATAAAPAPVLVPIPSPPPPPPPPLPVMLRERPIWEGDARDPGPTRPLVHLSREALDDAAVHGAVAASNAAATTPPVASPASASDAVASRVRYVKDELPEATLLPVEILFAPSSPSPAIRRAAAAHVGCCGVARLPAVDVTGVRDERAAAQHAMSHATQRSPAELARELEVALAAGLAAPSVALAGTLVPALDPAALFEVTHALARTFLADASHGDLLALASRVTSSLEVLPVETVTHVTARLEDALRAHARQAPVEAMREQTVLSRRRYQEARVFGDCRIVARIRLDAGGDVPCFLPRDAAGSLPMARSFRAHVIAVVRVAPWTSDGPIALDIVAAGRDLVVPRAR